MYYKSAPKYIKAWCFQDDSEEADFISEAMSKDLIIPHPMWPETRLQVTTEFGPTMHPVTKIVDQGDWIIQDDEGNLDVLKPEDFVDTYEPCEAPAA